MASLYRKPRSPYWYLQTRDPKSGRLLNRSTKLRADNPLETQLAKKRRAEAETQELSSPRAQSGEAWAAWAPAWLKVRYADADLTRERAEAAWKSLSTYFRELGIRSARILTREHCLGFMAWRLGPEGIAAGLRKARHNTALLEVKFLSTVMREAVARGLASSNVCLQLGLKRARGKVKPEISDAEIEKIESALASEKERPHNDAMRIAWEIALLQVCRLTETCVPLRDVDLAERTITFRVKGGGEHTAMLHPDLVPLFQRLKADGRERAYAMPRNFAKIWHYFFKRHGLGHLTFHSTRVTGVTRLRRQGVDLRVAMEFVGHSSVLVHRIYDRQRRDDQLAAVNALSRKPSSENAGSPGASGAHAKESSASQTRTHSRRRASR